MEYTQISDFDQFICVFQHYRAGKVILYSACTNMFLGIVQESSEFLQKSKKEGQLGAVPLPLDKRVNPQLSLSVFHFRK